MTSATVFLRPLQRTIELTCEESLLETLVRELVPIAHSCQGKGICGTCRVRVEKGLKSCPPMNSIESAAVHRLKLGAEERLACQLRLESKERLTVSTPYW